MSKYRTAGAAIFAALFIVMALLGAPSTLGGQTHYVSTYGVSMEPQFRVGDLAILRPADTYHVGDVVSYHSDVLDTTVMHRIMAVENDLYTFKGDNNSWLDPEQPTKEKLIGKLVLQVPQGGLWLERLTSPPVLGLIAFALVASGGTAVTSRNKRRNRRTAVSRHISDRFAAPAASSSPSLSSLSPSARAAAAGTAVLGILGAALGALAWTGPLEGSSLAEVKSGTSMQFSYTADVGQSAAYDGTTASSPDPVFRKLANSVDVDFSYQGDPGTVAVAAELSTPGGWRSTVPLTAPQPFTGNSYEGTVTLDLKALEAKADAAAAATGLGAAPVSIALIPQVSTESGAEFRPELQLSLTPLQLSLTGGEQDLTVADSSTSQQTVMAPRAIGFNDWSITAATARVVSAVLLLTALLAGAALLIVARRTTPLDEAAGIRRRYSSLLVRVHPMSAPHGRPVIDVTGFATLAKLAERYGLLVLHWNRSGVETFIVQDESTTYRYRAAGDESTAVESTPTGDTTLFTDAARQEPSS